MSKAYDEDSDKHFLISSVKEIPELKVQQIQYPIIFDTEYERNSYFDDLDVNSAKDFLERLIEQIKGNQKAVADDCKENDSDRTGGIVRSIGDNKKPV